MDGCNPCVNNGSIFGNSSQFIKTQNGDFIGVLGSNTVERLICGDLRIPYVQLLKSRIILKAGQTNYLLNFLGMGDNATFLAIKASYNPQSVNEEDNYVNWNYYTDFVNVYSMDQLMVLTGNSTNRIQQIYLTNPNNNYAVTLDVMVANIDDTYTFFPDTVNQSGLSFVDLAYTDIQTYVVNQSIVINDNNVPPNPLVYFNLSDIDAIERVGDIIIVDDSSLSKVFLDFSTAFDADQAQSLLNYVLKNPGITIADLDPVADTIPPVVYFNSTAGSGGDFIAFNGATSGVPYNTSDGYTFSTSISISGYGVTYSGTYSIDTPTLINLLIDYVSDNRDGTMSITNSNLIIVNTFSTVISSILSVGSYSLTFDITDIAQNNLNGVFMTLDIVS